MANWSPDRQQAVQARCEKATSGEWSTRQAAVMSDGGYDFAIVAAPVTADNIIAETFARGGKAVFHDAQANADFIAHARQDLPDALAELARQQADLTRLAEVNAQLRNTIDALSTMPEVEAILRGIEDIKAGRVVELKDAKEAARE